MTEYSSFVGLDNWLEELKKHGPNNLSMCIAGNKKDLQDEWKVTKEQLKQKAKSVDASYILTSALEDEGIEVGKQNVYFNYARKPLLKQ